MKEFNGTIQDSKLTISHGDNITIGIEHGFDRTTISIEPDTALAISAYIQEIVSPWRTISEAKPEVGDRCLIKLDGNPDASPIIARYMGKEWCYAWDSFPMNDDNLWLKIPK